MLAVFHDRFQILEQRHFTTNLVELCRIEMAVLTDEIGSGFGLCASAIVAELGLEKILVTTETPVADVVLGQAETTREFLTGGSGGGTD